MQPSRATIAFPKAPRSIHVSGQLSPAVYRFEDLELAREEAAREVTRRVTAEAEEKIAAVQEELSDLKEGVLKSLSDQFSQALSQMRGLLPQLVVEATARVVGGIKVDESVVRGVVDDLLSEVAPGAEQLEVQLCEADFATLQGDQSQFKQKFPSIVFRSNSELRSGDCMVKTRFGVLDGRLQTKIRGLESLLG